MNVPMADLPAQHHALKAELTTAFEEIISSCKFILGDPVARLETEIAALCGAAYGIGVNSGTDALLLALRALGIGPGDEVITTPFTFGATAETIRLIGATPVFADIDPQTFNLDPEKAASKITDKTKAIMPVHLFGQMADMTQFQKIAQEHSLGMIEDAAQAIGASHYGKPIGSWSEFSTLSFYPTKNLGGCGDGGMILTHREEFAAHLRLLRSHGSGGSYGYYQEIGYCSRLDGLQAALLHVKARYLHDWNEARRRHAALYEERLGGLREHLTLPSVAHGSRHIYHQYTLRVTHGHRDALQKHLIAQGISCAVYYPLSLHQQDAYADLGGQTGDLPISEQASREVLSIPVHPDLTISQVEYTAEAIRSFFTQ